MGDADNKKDYPKMKPWPAIFKDLDVAKSWAKIARRHRMTVEKNRVRVHI